MINARLSITSKGSTGDRCQLVQNTSKVPVRQCLFLRTQRDDFFDEPGRLITVHTLALSIPILQLSDILLREINFQCVLEASVEREVSRRRRSHLSPQERVAEQKTEKFSFVNLSPISGSLDRAASHH